MTSITVAHFSVRLKRFFRVLSVAYLVGAVLHFMDLLDLRLTFSEMNPVWKVWIVFLFTADAVAAAGLWTGKIWGVVAFLVVAASQVFAYTLLSKFFGSQVLLIVFHIASLSVFFLCGGFHYLRQELRQ